MKKRIVREVVINRSVYGSLINENKFEPDRLTEVAAWVAKMLDAVPAEYRKSARMEIESVGGYEGEHHAEVTITYERPETDAEVAERREEDAARRRYQEDEERRQYESLCAKFEARTK